MIEQQPIHDRRKIIVSDSTEPLWAAGLSDISVFTVLPRLDHLQGQTPKASSKGRSAPVRTSKERKTQPKAPKRRRRAAPEAKRDSEV